MSAAIAGAATAIFARVALGEAMLPTGVGYSILDGVLFTLCLAGFAYTRVVDTSTCKKIDVSEDLAYIRARLDMLTAHLLIDKKERKD